MTTIPSIRLNMTYLECFGKRKKKFIRRSLNVLITTAPFELKQGDLRLWVHLNQTDDIDILIFFKDDLISQFKYHPQNDLQH